MAGTTWDIRAVPAYGRDYKSAAEVKSDWEAGKDFRCATTGRYFSVRDNPTTDVWVRYDKMRKLVRVH